MTILKKLRKAAFKQTVILLILGLIFVVIGGIFVVMPDNPPTDLTKMTYKELSEDKFVSLTKFAFIYEYGSIDEDDGTKWFCVVAAMDKNDVIYLMTLKVTEAEGQRLKDMTDLNAEGLQWLSDQFYYGSLATLPSDAKTFYDEEITYLAPPTDVIVTHYYIDATPGVYELDNTGNIVGGTVFIALGLLIAILPILMMLGVGQRSVYKTAAKLAVGGNARFYLEDFDAKATEVNGVYFSDEAILFNQGYNTRLLPLKDLVWAFRRAVDQRLYFFIRIATYHFITVMTPDKKKHQLMFRKEAQMEAVMTALKEHCPDLVVTQYDRQLEKIFKQDPSSFKAAVTELSQRQKAKADEIQKASDSNSK